MRRTVVVLVNYHGASDANKCIQSLLTSSDQPQLVVVDNSPNDPEIESVVASYPGAKLIRAPENLGFGRGNNLGIDWALANTDCEFVFILNNDTTVQTDTIEKLQKVLDTRQGVGVATCRIVMSDNPDLLWYGGGEIDWRRGAARVPGFMKSSNAPMAMQSREVGFASGCAMLFRREALQMVGGFDPLFFMYEEDVDLCIRVRKRYSIFYDSSALIFHKVQGSQRDSSKPFQGRWTATNPNFIFHVYHMTRNSVINARKHAKGINKLVWLLCYPIFLISKILPASSQLGFSAIKPAISGLIDGMRVKSESWRI